MLQLRAIEDLDRRYLEKNGAALSGVIWYLAAEYYSYYPQR